MARVSKVAAGVAARKGKAEKKVRTTNWNHDYLNWSQEKVYFSTNYVKLIQFINFFLFIIIDQVIKNLTKFILED